MHWHTSLGRDGNHIYCYIELLAKSNESKFAWDEFRINFTKGGYYEFKYKDKYFNVGVEVKGTFRKTEKWIFVVHKHDNTGAEIYSEYKTPQLLLENARIDSKSIKEIWDELELE